MEEVEREEIGKHYRSQSHKRHRSELLREATAYRDQCEVGNKLCGACPALVSSDYTCVCRYGWFRYYDGWYRNLFGYYNPDTGQIDEIYPLDIREENYDWQIVALRPDACQRQIGEKHKITMPPSGILQGITGGWKPDEKQNPRKTELPDVTVDWIEEEEPEQPDFFTGWEKVIKSIDL